MAKKSEVVKIPKREQTIIRLKLLTKYLIDPDNHTLERLCASEKQEINKLKKRVYSYLLSFPKLIHYLNTYLNNLYDYNKYTPQEWFYTFSEIIRMYNFYNIKNSLHFAKYKSSERDNFIQTINNYMDELTIQRPSRGELDAYYVLYKNFIITDSHMDHMNEILKGKISKTDEKESSQKSVFQPTIATSTTHNPKDRSFQDLSPEIQEFCKNIINYTKNRKACSNHCALAHKERVVLDTNLTKPGPVDIVFIGINPGEEERKKGISFIGGAGQILRPYVYSLCDKYNLKWLFMNIILCSTPNENEIKSVMSKTVKQCSQIYKMIEEQFPAKIKVLLGKSVVESFGIKGALNSIIGRFMGDKIACVHPSSLQYNSKLNKPRLENCFSVLDDYFANNSAKNTPNQNINVPDSDFNVDDIRIPEEKIIKRFEKDLTLLDITILNSKIIYIFVDGNEEKKYLIDDVKFPIFIKNGTYKDCKMIESLVDSYVVVNEEEKKKIMSTLNQNLIHLTRFN